MAELGAGGGQGDLNQQCELEVGDPGLVGQLIALCASKLQSQKQLLAGVLELLTSAINDGVPSITLDDCSLISKSEMTESQEDELDELSELPLGKLVPALAKLVTKRKQKKAQTDDHNRTRWPAEPSKRADGLPKQIVSSFGCLNVTNQD